MKVLLLSHYLENYQKLADVVNTNKEEYCKIHGYDYRAMVGDYVDAPFGFQRIKAMLDIMAMGTYNIIWWTDIDSIILNFTKRIEDFVDDDQNSYLYTLYARPDTTEGHVKKGDLLLHIPGSSLEDRINIFNSQQIKDLTIR